MANTYTQIYIQTVFAVENRDCLIQTGWKDELYKYITGIVKSNGHKLIAINGMADHVHIFIGMKPDQSVSDLPQDIKGGSSKWINEKRFVGGKFQWQSGYGAFSYSQSHVDKVVKYIRRQEEHHKRKIFKEEYVSLLKAFQIEHNDKYVFKWIEE